MRKSTVISPPHPSRTLIVFALLAVGVLPVRPVHAQVYLENLVDEETGGRPHTVAMADVNGDGTVDIVTAFDSPGLVRWYSNDGDENFTAQLIYDEAANSAYEILPVDIDMDGDIDVLNFALNTDQIYLYKSDGVQPNPGWTRTTLHSIDGPFSPRVADIDGDGDLDIAVGLGVAGNGGWLENDGSESFSFNAVNTNNDNPRQLIPVDLDEDGDVDLVSCTQATKLSWHPNPGNQAFPDNGTETVIDASGNCSSGLEVVDLDGDGDLDIVSGTGNLYWFENDGSENFTERLLSTGGAYVPAVGDIDADGDLDVIGSGAASTIVLFNDGSETFTQESISDRSGVPFVGDLDGDSALEIAVAVDQPTNSVFWIDPISGEVDFGDADGDSYQTDSGSPAVHLIDGPYLGTVAPDGETNGQRKTGTADGDDDAGTDDEDGLLVPASIPAIVGATVTFSMTATSPSAGAVRVHAWLDADGNGTFDADEDYGSLSGGSAGDPVTTSAGTKVFTVTLPADVTAATTYVRIRICSTATSCDSPGGYATDGEVEDYQVTIVDTDNLTLQAGARIDTDGTDITITHADGSSTTFAIADLTTANTLTLTGSSTSDSVTLSPALLNTSGLIVNVNLGAGFDSLTLPRGTASGTVTYTHTNANDGQIAVTGGATINYTGLDPIIDNLDAANRVFTFSGFGETITLTPDGDGSTGNGYSFIDSDFGESVLFKNPTTTLTINAGAGADTVVLGAMDTPVATTFTGITVNGGDGAGTDTAADSFQITPSDDYPVDVFGENTRGTCPVDGLSIVGTAVIATQDDPGTGTITFSSGEEDVDFTNIEAVGSADIALSLSSATIYATDQLAASTGNALEVSVTNHGPDDAACVTVALDPDFGDFMLDVSSSGDGSFIDPAWDAGALADGATKTLVLEGFVATNSPRTATFTATAAEDGSADNNEAELEVSLGFPFPDNVQVLSAGYTTKTISVAGETYSYDQLMVGLFQGAPGIEGAVWCQVPGDISNVSPSTIWPVAPLTAEGIAGHWRPCSNGLPFPLHPNGFFEDDDGDLWLPVWGSAGLYKSTNGGASWTAAWPELGPGDASEGTYWTQVYAMTQDAADIYYISANNGRVYRSLDGALWQEVAPLPHVAADTPWSLAGHPTEDGVVYAGTFGKGVYITDDFGSSWEVFGGSAENNVLLGNPDNDPQNPDDLEAGYIFDLAFSPDNDEFLFAATSKGVWRADLDATDPTTIDAPGWAFMGPELTIEEGGVDVDIVPEVRSLAFNAQTGDADDDLFIGTWGRGAHENANPTTTTGFSALSLRASHITFVAVSASGELAVGSSDGSIETMTAPSGATSTAAEPEARELPDGYALSQNYPNPFNPVTRIGFALPETGHIRLAVYDALGREVAVLVDGLREAGRHEVAFDAKGLPTGTYLYRMETAKGAIARILTLMK